MPVTFISCNYLLVMFLAGKSKDEAMSDYITKVKQLLEEAGLSA